MHTDDFSVRKIMDFNWKYLEVGFKIDIIWHLGERGFGIIFGTHLTRQQTSLDHWSTSWDVARRTQSRWRADVWSNFWRFVPSMESYHVPVSMCLRLVWHTLTYEVLTLVLCVLSAQHGVQWGIKSMQQLQWLWKAVSWKPKYHLPSLCYVTMPSHSLLNHNTTTWVLTTFLQYISVNKAGVKESQVRKCSCRSESIYASWAPVAVRGQSMTSWLRS